jgi:hypothetical protein
MEKNNNLNVTNAVSELFTALQNEANAEKRVMDTFVKAYQTEAQGVCDKLNDLKAKATGKKAPQKAKELYKKKRLQVQNACARSSILEVLFGDDANRTTLSITQVKGKGFAWNVDTIEPEQVAEKNPEGTETEVIDMPQSENTKDLTMVNTEYLAEFGTTETIVTEIEQTIAMLEETLANIKAKSA